ncbi:DUF445 domain-containing protein [Corynebacterium sp. 13CS0277]|uniref:DUF445 domain-containing protein n=1 Tax=Corynebacterium sp. 13CS0277 TaxID=2071994 RepID=UPI000D02EBA8|nr:DUF445 family protein [Corynebacterium sp. 13CS0277]PRQ12198.1 DUF445 domain-containing protein [Corynebacterium sp. 13CS0277]
MSTPLAVPSPSAEVEAAKRAQLARYKLLATGLLVVAAVVFITCQVVEHTTDAGAWVGYVRAAAEAGMVGGLADWFAVTALFRRPLNLPIPHTAIVKNKKDQIGDSLGGFVSENFLNADLISAKVSEAQLPLKLGRWLSDPQHADTVSREAGTLVANVLRALDPAEAEAVIKHALIDKVAGPEWGPPAGRVLAQLMQEGRTQPVVEELIGWLHRKALGSEDLIHRLVDERRPAWAPRFVNDIVGDKVYRELVTWTSEVTSNPDHEARQAIARGLATLAEDLQHDPEMIARVEGIKADVLGSEAVTAAPARLWAVASAGLIAAAEDPQSLLRTKLAAQAHLWGQRLVEDEELRARLNARVVKAAAFLATNYGDQVTAIISETVRRWDADEAVDKIELMVGKDLQYIRLNGTIVGALAGLVIYTGAQVLVHFL